MQESGTSEKQNKYLLHKYDKKKDDYKSEIIMKDRNN